MRFGGATRKEVASYDLMRLLIGSEGTLGIITSAWLRLIPAPELALPLIRKGLLADVPIDRTTVAAILALIGKPWSLRELLEALEASDDQEKTADVRAALLETGDPEAERAVREAEDRANENATLLGRM